MAVKESILDLVEMGETKLGREGRETFTVSSSSKAML